VEGKAIYRDQDLLQLDEKSMTEIRGREIAIIFQNPSLALNPVYKIGDQVSEPLILKKRLSRSRAEATSTRLLRRLGLKGREDSYPFQLSGGMNQRAMIACSVALGPKMIIADEPTKGLDQSLVGQVLNEIRQAKEMNDASLLLITHDLEVAREISDRIAVMYCGEVVEMGRTEEILQKPHHPYTRALLNSLPERGFLPIPGSSPSMIAPPLGCKFHPRCPLRKEVCSTDRPELNFTSSGWSRCWL
jgi:peptide/nickel transport system ATP-binding protein